MRRPRFYPHRPRSVQFTQTHISYVFLAGSLVYKVKKPVDFGFLDYSTLRKRAAWCRREVELNRRLAPDLYLGVVPVFARQGEFSLDRPGRVAEYAVVMKRLPEEKLFSSLMAEGRGTGDQARAIARRVAAFHASIPQAPPPNRRLAVLKRNLDDNFQLTRPYIGRTVSAEDYRVVYDYNAGFLRERLSLLRKRIREGRIRDCHGDLHAEHICLSNGVIIYDCLEFSPRLRRTDVAAEVAFLYMDLLYHRHPHLARTFAEEYIRLSGDWEVRLLLPFYACYRAVVREKVESLRFSDPHVPAAQKATARRRAARYFHLARDLARRDGQARLFTVGGLPGTGKSTLSALWADRLGAVLFASDAVRKDLARSRGGTRPSGGWQQGIYTPQWTRRTYEELVGRAERSLAEGHSVVLDATFARRSQRRLAAGAARRTGARCVTVECVCSSRLARKRLEERSRGPSLSDADWKIHRAVKREYLPPRRSTVRIDTGGDLEEGLAAMAEASYPL
jgi:hypothetical protein